MAIVVDLWRTSILGRRLGDGDRFADVTLGDRIAIGVDRDIAVQIDDAFEQLVDRRQYVGQRNEVRLLDDVGGVGRHAQRLLWFAVGDVAAPGERLAVEVVEIGEAPADEKIRLDIGERPFDPAFAIRVAHPVRAEAEAERAGEGGDLRRDDGVGARRRRRAARRCCR